jgi:hypothetical protein
MFWPKDLAGYLKLTCRFGSSRKVLAEEAETAIMAEASREILRRKKRGSG